MFNLWLLAVLILQTNLLALPDDTNGADDWTSRFAFSQPASATTGTCLPSGDKLPGFTVIPSAEGSQLVRVSLPFAPGAFPAELGLIVHVNHQEIIPDLRPLTYHPGQPRYVRRAIITFMYDFRHCISQEFHLRLADKKRSSTSQSLLVDKFNAHIGNMNINLSPEGLEVHDDRKLLWRAGIIAPASQSTGPVVTEIIEQGQYYLWLRMLIPDVSWPRILELRADSLGTIAAKLHLQRLLPGDGRAPDIGWRITGARISSIHNNNHRRMGIETIEHPFNQAKQVWIQSKSNYIRFPDAHLKKRGMLICTNNTNGSEITYLRSLEEEQVPHQHAAWRTALFVLGKLETAPWTALMEPEQQIQISPKDFNTIYDESTPINLSPWPVLDKVRRFHIEAMAGGSLLGDDFGNVTSLPKPDIFGMNRLNHCPSIFHEYYRTGDPRLRNVALQWCNNFHDLSIWWGTTGPPQFDHRSLSDWITFAKRMKSRTNDKMADALNRIWERLNDKTREAINNVSDSQTISSQQKLSIARSLNELLKRRDLYEVSCWQKMHFDDAALALIKKGIPYLTEEQVIILNRYLLEAVFPNEIIQNKPFYRSRFGGTRYNNMARHHAEYRDDKSFMWRSNRAVSFCTKGYDSYFYAYEETGDPRMATALRWQTEFAKIGVQADRGECRNIGDVQDFVRLHRFTGKEEYRNEGLRLFRELRTCLSEGNLFSQGGKPIVIDLPFIDDDSFGYQHPFAKPYILGYALAGLPALAEYYSDEPKLREVIHAVADFMVESQDPLGGWRYPHPCSSRMIVSQGIEHAAQLVNAASYLENQGESISKLLDAIERVLQARILVWKKTGKIFGGLRGWEATTGLIGDKKTIYDLYKKPGDRNRDRDYTEGSISLGGSSPEGVVYFSKVLNFYLAHRPAERLFYPNPPLKAILERLAYAAEYSSSQPTGDYIGYGVEAKLPTFRDAIINRLSFPLRFNPQGNTNFKQWRSAARAKLLECLLTPPPRAAFEPVVIAREDRGSYQAQKIVFNVSADCRIPAYLLVPQGPGPFPAIIALHDHGAHFLIGKEKVIQPFDAPQEILSDAQRWVSSSYGNRFIGDELAKRGYVVFSIDALFWGERGLKEGVDYTTGFGLQSFTNGYDLDRGHYLG